MPSFDYTASDRTGLISKGIIEAKSRSVASRSLVQRGLFVLEIVARSDPLPARPQELPLASQSKRSTSSLKTTLRRGEPHLAKGPSEPTRKGWRRPWTHLQQTLYLRQLSVLFQAGVPIHRATESLAKSDSYTPELQELLIGITADLECGRTLSRAFAKSGLFKSSTITSLQVAQQSGSLHSILERLAENEERSLQLKRSVVSKLTYPAVIFSIVGVGFVVIGHLLSKLLASLPGVELDDVPVFGVLNAALAHPLFLPVCALLSGVIALLLTMAWSDRQKRLLIEQAMIKIPVLGELIRRMAVDEVSSQLSLLLKAGQRIDRALGSVSDLVWLMIYQEDLKECQTALREGRELNDCLSRSRLFPRDVLALIAAGEVTGSLEESFSRIAAYSSDQVERTLASALELLEPLMIAALGVAIGAIICCTFIPVYDSLQNLS